MNKITLPVLFLLLLTSCKTTEEIRREQLVDNLSIQVGQSQKIATDTLSKLQELEERMNKMTGNWEETHIQKAQSQGEQLQDLSSRVTELETKLNILQDIQDKLEEQNKFIKGVTKSLKRLGSSGAPRSSKKKQSTYQKATQGKTPTATGLGFAIDIMGKN